MSLSFVTDGCRDGDSQRRGFDGQLHSYVFLIASSAAMVVLSITSIAAVVICWHRLHKR